MTPARGTSTMRGMRAYISVALLSMLSLQAAVIVCGEFTERPMMPENVTLNEDVVFRCRHLDAVAYGWYINGSILGNNPPPDISPSFNTLTIIALPRNNNTVIECVAFILNGTQLLQERSPSAILIVPDNCGSRMVSTAVRSFIEVPLSQTVAEGVQVRFRCRHRATNTLVWEVDGVLFNQTSTLNASTFAVPIDGGTARHVLLFDAILSYHHTSIVCAAIFSNGCPQQKTMPALLLIQGPLRAISGVFRDNLANQEGVSYFWEPPSTLDLTGVEPDIVYCVEVSNITCGADNLIASDCELTNPIYPASVGDGLDPSYVYEITVIPRSNVPGAANGSVFTKRERFMSVKVSPRHVMENSTGIVVEFNVFVNDTESERLIKARARSYSIEIVSTDDPQTSVSEIIGEGGDRVAVLLSKRQHWRYIVFAYGCQPHPVSITNEISTFAVQNISVTSGAPGELQVTGDFITNTSAIGMLTIVYSTENDSDIHYAEARLPQTEIHLTGLSENVYSISVFTLEENGLPFNQTAHYLREINVHRGKKSTQTNISVEYELQEMPTCIKVLCTFLDSSTTDCVAVVHQQISQLHSSGLMSIESSHKFNRSGDTAHGCIPLIDLQQFQVGVVGGRLITKSGADPLSSGCSTECILGSVLGSIGGCLVIVVIIVGIVILSWRRFYNKESVDMNAHVHEGTNGGDIPLRGGTPDSSTADTKAAIGTTGDPVVVVPTIEPSAETIEEIQDDHPSRQGLHDNLPAPFLGANSDGLRTREPLVDGGLPSGRQISSTATIGETPVIKHNDADPSNSGNAESSVNSLHVSISSELTMAKGEQLNQEHSSGNGPKITYQPTEATRTDNTAVVAIGMSPSSFPSESVTRNSTVATADGSEMQEQMLSLNAAGKLITEDLQPELFQSKPPVRALFDLPTHRTSRQHLDARASSSQPVQSSLNNFNKNEWPENEQPETESNGSSNKEETMS